MSSYETRTLRGPLHGQRGTVRSPAPARVLGTSRKVLAATLIGTCLLGVAGCGPGGFRPVYGDSPFGNGGVADQMASIEVAPIPGRVGQRIRNEVRYQTTGGDLPLPPVYRLEVAVRETVNSTLVSQTGDVGQQVYAIDATFRLIDAKTKAVVFSGNSFARASFERFQSVFANVRAKRDAQDRAARKVGTDLKSRLEAFLAARA